MATVVDQQQMVRLLEEEFRTICDLCAGLADDQWDTPTALPGWSVKDNLSHMIGTESALLGIQAPSSDDKSDNTAKRASHVKNKVGEANEAWVQSMRPVPGRDVLSRFRDVTVQRTEVLSAMTQQEFDAPSWSPAGPDESYGRFMRIRHYDCFMHEHDIRDALGIPDRPSPDDVRSSLAEVSAALGYVVGKKAQIPTGNTVRIELTGQFEAVLNLVVQDRATLVDKLSAPPTVLLRMPVMLFFRLTGGRIAAGPHIGQDLTLLGDMELATALAENLAFTI